MATITINAEQAKIVAALSTARQAMKDAEQAEKIAKEQIAEFAPNIGDVLVLDGITVAKITEGTRSGLDPEIVKRRAPGAYRQARTLTRFRKVTIA